MYLIFFIIYLILFLRCFRALAAHIERNVPLPHFDGINIPEEKPISDLLELTHDDEALRESLAREKKEEEERAAKEKRMQLLVFHQSSHFFIFITLQRDMAALSIARTSSESPSKYYYDYDYSDDDSDSGYVGSNGKRYLDYSEWYASDSFDEDWHD